MFAIEHVRRFFREETVAGDDLQMETFKQGIKDERMIKFFCDKKNTGKQILDEFM